MGHRRNTLKERCILTLHLPIYPFRVFQESKALLAFLSRDVLHGEGDVVKHLSHLGYRVSYEQTKLNEYDYTVSNLAVDLCDGVRITRQVWCAINYTADEMMVFLCNQYLIIDLLFIGR